MLIPLEYLISNYNVKPFGLVQCGAHFSEEHNWFINAGCEKFVYVEPCKKAFQVLLDLHHGNKNIKLFNVAAGAKSFETEMYIETANQGQSNSILKPKDHLIQHPSIIFNSKEEISVSTLDSLDFNYSDYNFLMSDTQGYDLEVLKGATNFLQSVDYVYTEVNSTSIYENCALVGEIDEFLWKFGFESIEEHWVGGWGDKFYAKKELLKHNHNATNHK